MLNFTLTQKYLSLEAKFNKTHFGVFNSRVLLLAHISLTYYCFKRFSPEFFIFPLFDLQILPIILCFHFVIHIRFNRVVQKVIMSRVRFAKNVLLD